MDNADAIRQRIMDFLDQQTENLLQSQQVEVMQLVRDDLNVRLDDMEGDDEAE